MPMLAFLGKLRGLGLLKPRPLAQVKYLYVANIIQRCGTLRGWDGRENLITKVLGAATLQKQENNL